MRQPVSQKRPWLAALLGVLATGLGHAYLRRWWRAFAWIAALFAVSVLSVDSGMVDVVANGNPLDLVSATPVLVVASLSALDAYLLARVQNAMERLSPTDGELTHCPNCGKELDPDLDFCQWCSTDLARFGPQRTGASDGE